MKKLISVIEPKWAKIFSIFVALSVMMSSCGSVDRDPSDRIEEASYQIAKQEVKKQLNYPATADFSLLSVKREKFGTSTYRITGKLTAKNVFGVEQELKYMVTMTYFEGDPFNPSSWNITTCDVKENR